MNVLIRFGRTRRCNVRTKYLCTSSAVAGSQNLLNNLVLHAHVEEIQAKVW
jgi:hypothetical protein